MASEKDRNAKLLGRVLAQAERGVKPNFKGAKGELQGTGGCAHGCANDVKNAFRVRGARWGRGRRGTRTFPPPGHSGSLRVPPVPSRTLAAAQAGPQFSPRATPHPPPGERIEARKRSREFHPLDDAPFENLGGGEAGGYRKKKGRAAAGKMTKVTKKRIK